MSHRLRELRRDGWGAIFGAIRRYGLLERLPRAVGAAYARFGALRDAREAALFVRELQVKLHLSATVTAVGIDAQDDFWEVVARELDRNEDFPPFVLEGVANKYFTLHPDEKLRDVLSQPAAAAMTCPTQISMLHIGLGMALSREYLKRFCETADAHAQRAIVADFFRRADDSALPGYGGCVVEALGLVSELYFSGQDLVSRWSALLADGPEPSEQRLHRIALMHHGLGRIVFFHPKRLVPIRGGHLRYGSLLEAERVVEQLAAHYPHGPTRTLAADNVVAGLFWAITATSLTQPELLVDYLRHAQAHCPTLMQHGSAIADGIHTNLLMLRFAEAPQDQVDGGARPLVERQFFAYEPQDAAERFLWRRYVTDPFASVDLAQSAPAAVENVYRV